MELTGTFLDYFIVFAAGVVVSFTPCVYPVMPLTVTFIGAVNTRGTKRTGFLISLVYVFGIAVTYCTLAAVAALTGKFFGQFQNNPLTYGVVSAVLFFFSLVLLDVIPMRDFGADLRQKIKPRDLWTVGLFGAVSGLVIGPCTAPILGTLLLYVASKQNVWHGISLLFVFSYGVGASLILLGTFSGLAARLPKSGIWMQRIKHGCAVLILLLAIYYAYRTGQLIFIK